MHEDCYKDITFSSAIRDSKRSMDFAKTMPFISGYVLVNCKAIHHDIMTARFYLSKSGWTMKCIVTVRDDKEYTFRKGVGIAEGAGYHKQSTALESALHDCGITGFGSISGLGNTAMEDCMFRIAAKLGYDSDTVHLVRIYND